MKHNFRETEEENDCTICLHFCSWYDFMGDNDDLEPKEYGKCENALNDAEEESLHCGEGDVCDLFTKIK